MKNHSFKTQHKAYSWKTHISAVKSYYAFDKILRNFSCNDCNSTNFIVLNMTRQLQIFQENNKSPKQIIRSIKFKQKWSFIIIRIFRSYIHLTLPLDAKSSRSGSLEPSERPICSRSLQQADDNKFIFSAWVTN